MATTEHQRPSITPKGAGPKTPLSLDKALWGEIEGETSQEGWACPPLSWKDLSPFSLVHSVTVGLTFKVLPSEKQSLVKKKKKKTKNTEVPPQTSNLSHTNNHIFLEASAKRQQPQRELSNESQRAQYSPSSPRLEQTRAPSHCLINAQQRMGV